MIQQLREWWGERSPREQTMLGIMFGLLAVTILWFGVIAPIFSGLINAHKQHARAVTDLAAIQSKAAILKCLKANPPPPLGAPVASFVNLSAGEAGFTLSRNDAVGTDAAAIAIVSAKPAAFFAWITALEQKGVFVEQMTVRTNNDATIGIDATLKARTQ